MQGLKANTFATAMSALGQKRAFALQKPHVRFTPDSDRERGHGGRPRENARTPYGPGKGVVGTANSAPKYAELLCTTSREFLFAAALPPPRPRSTGCAELPWKAIYGGPLCLRTRTRPVQQLMSAMGQKRTLLAIELSRRRSYARDEGVRFRLQGGGLTTEIGNSREYLLRAEPSAAGEIACARNRAGQLARTARRTIDAFRNSFRCLALRADGAGDGLGYRVNPNDSLRNRQCGLPDPSDQADHRVGTILDARKRLGRARGQYLDLLRHDGEATAGFSGARGLDCSVEREQIGLAGDGVNHGGDFLDIFHHRVQAVSIRRRRIGPPRGLGYHLHRVGQLPVDVLHRHRQFLDRGGDSLRRDAVLFRDRCSRAGITARLFRNVIH